MARITLFRHSKAETPSLQKADIDRLLTTRGTANARRMGQFIAAQKMLPDRILVSQALRTRQTYELASEDWPDIPVTIIDKIYEANTNILLSIVAEHAGDDENVMIIGHNPGLVVLLNHMVGSSHTDGNLSYFPTSCVADIGFEAPKLRDINVDDGRLLSIIRVRDLSD